MVIFSQIDRVRLTLGHLQLAWMGFPSKLLLKDKSPPSTRNLGVGFYFLLLILLMYVNRATINVLKRIIIVIASSICMDFPPFLRRETMTTQDSIVHLLYHLHPSRTRMLVRLDRGVII
jgi:hypothetical protein